MSMWALSRNRGNGLFSVHHFAPHMLMNSMRIYARTTEWILENRERKKGMNEKNGTILVRAVNRKSQCVSSMTKTQASHSECCHRRYSELRRLGNMNVPYLVRSDGTHSPVSHLSVFGCYLLSALVPVDLFEARGESERQNGIEFFDAPEWIVCMNFAAMQTPVRVKWSAVNGNHRPESK